MKTKIDYAHEYAMKHLENSRGNIAMTSLVSFAWQYADAMQIEADKRSITGTPEAILKASNSRELEWQPDWSQAPDDRIDHWSKESNETATWWVGEPTRNIKEGTHHDNDQCECVEDAPLFGYQGNWQDSLRKRPKSS